MFIDDVEIVVVGGKGGDGCTSFRHEKFIEMGGPDGGNGGRGGSIVFLACGGLKTLLDLRYKKTIKAQKGEPGSGANKTGASAEDTIIQVPIGTTVRDTDTGLILCDLVTDGQREVIAKGGRGGKGNAAFLSNKNKAPQVSEHGEPGETRNLKCDLKLLADVGLVGFPSVGKSSIIAEVSACKPKVAAYHFTTLSPNLGVVSVGETSFVMADLPGIIEGASDGVGLGLEFLKHASRCKVLAHVLDMSGSEGRNPIEDYKIISNEMKLYSEKLYNKRTIVVANKMDIEGAKENLKAFVSAYPELEVFETVAVARIGLDELMKRLAALLQTEKDAPIYEEKEFEEYVLYQFKKEVPFSIEKDNDVWVIKGDKIEKLFKMTKFNSDEAELRFARKLSSLGVDSELIRHGAEYGDTVRLLDYEFELEERLS
ncbi:MAG: GTPase ObgE [Bacilli bacterium]